MLNNINSHAVINDRLKLIVKYLIGQGFASNQEKLGELLGYTNKASFSHILNGRKPLPSDFIDRICLLDKKVNKVWIETGAGRMVVPEVSTDNSFTVTGNNIVANKAGGNVTVTQESNNSNVSSTPKYEEAVPIAGYDLVMVPLVSQYAYAGYTHGFSDAEYLGTLPKIPYLADRQLKGNYVSFEVKGDSMEDGSDNSIKEGDRLICREVKKDYWKYKLHIKKWDFVIVHQTEGILIKEISDHNVETGEIILHSLNDYYPDIRMNLKDVSQLFNVIDVLRSRKK